MSNKQNDHFYETAKEAEGELSTTGDCKRSILHADEIVSNLKNITRIIERYAQIDDIDFLGCSALYCIEKICKLETALKYLKNNVRIIDKR